MYGSDFVEQSVLGRAEDSSLRSSGIGSSTGDDDFGSATFMESQCPDLPELVGHSALDSKFMVAPFDQDENGRTITSYVSNQS